jgi:hypothetical protein
MWMGSFVSQIDRFSIADTGFNMTQVFATTGDM